MLHDDGTLDDRFNLQDGSLRMVDDPHRLNRSKRTGIIDRKRTSAHIPAGQLAASDLMSQFGDFPCDAFNRFFIGMLANEQHVGRR